MSPETPSPFSDRPIRPLPKRRLRERLSPDVADSIKYPPVPRIKSPLFYHPYNLRDDSIFSELQNPTLRERIDEVEKNYISRRNWDDILSDEEDSTYHSRIFPHQTIGTAARSYRYIRNLDSECTKPQPPGSTVSSADGYESFENTNNKKKRKIPTPGDANLNGSRIISDINGSSNSDDFIEDLVQQSPGSSQGISGAGRGRYGRNRNGRSPLRTLSDALSGWGTGRTQKQRQPQWSSASESGGIISRSIANAFAENNPVTPSRGYETMSLFQQPISKNSSPAATEFTFTCDPQIPGTVPWPGSSSCASMYQSPVASRMSTHATQTSPNIHSNRNVANTKENQPFAPNGKKQTQSPTVPTKKTRRRTGKEYLLAAKQRRNQQGYRNFHNPVSSEDIWICEFCEYERIFGCPPEALIKQYEIKDKRIRKQEAERRRLLEKAKMKGRKGKKGNKPTSKFAPTLDRQSPLQNQNVPNSPVDNNQSQSLSTQSDEYFEDEYDNALQFGQNPPRPSPTAPPSISQIDNYSNDDGLNSIP
ncbi:hypothetical protein K3495_g1589 [Podosphaera aphanis]|nr:hypothetical protein K3495_g1589 [Podosphaera aphanis]